MRIFAKTLTSERTMIDVPDTMQIMDVKDLISEPLGVRPELQRLVFEGTELNNRATLRDCTVREGDVLLVLPRGQLRVLSLIMDRVLCDVKDLQHEIIRLQDIEENLDEFWVER